MKIKYLKHQQYNFLNFYKLFCIKNDIKISWKKIWFIKITISKSTDRSQLGPRLLIKFLQDAAGRGDLDPWDIDVISVIDSFLEQFNQNLRYSSNDQN